MRFPTFWALSVIACVVAAPIHAQPSPSGSKPTAPAATPAPPPSAPLQPTPRYHEYVLDLGSNAIVGTLPFDVPFTLIGRAGPLLKRVDIWYERSDELLHGQCALVAQDSVMVLEIRTKQKTSPVAVASALDTTLVRGVDRINGKDVRVFVAKSVTQASAAAQLKAKGIDVDTVLVRSDVIANLASASWVRGTNSTLSEFRLPMHKLEPNRPYTFCVRTNSGLSDSDKTHLAERATTNITPPLKAIIASIKSYSDGITATQVAAVQKGLNDALTPNTRSALPKGSKFDTSGTDKLRKSLASIHDLAALRASDTALIESAAHAVGHAYDSIIHDTVALRFIVSHRPSRDMLGLDRARLTLGYQVALSLEASAKVNRADTTAEGVSVGRGRGALDDFGSASLRPLPDTALDTALLVPYVANVKRTLECAQALQELAIAILHDTPTPPPALLVLIDAIGALSFQAQQVVVNYGMLNTVLAQYPGTVTALVNSIDASDIEFDEVWGTSDDSLKARAAFYISADVGFLYAFRVDQAIPYAGANFYFRPVNKDAHLDFDCPFWTCMGQRTSITLGISLTSVKRDSTVENLFGSTSMILGGGFRVFDFVRLSSGVLIMRTFDNDRLRHSVINTALYGGASIDFTLKDLLGPVANAFGK